MIECIVIYQAEIIRLQELITKLQRYIFPEDILAEEDRKVFIREENTKVRDHVLLLSFLLIVIYPCYYFFYDFKVNGADKSNFWRIFRFSIAISSIVSLFFYKNYKNLNSKIYKLPFLLLGFIVIIGHTIAYSHSLNMTLFMPYVIVMIMTYTAKMSLRYNIAYLCTTMPLLYFSITSTGKPSFLLLSNTVVTFVIVMLFSLRNYTSARQFKKMNDLNNKLKDKNNFLNITQNQLIHDVKSPLMALKYLSENDTKSKKLLKSATERVEKIILDLEENSNPTNITTKFDIKSCIEGLIEEAKIKYKDILHEVNIICEFELKSKDIEILNLDKIVFSRIISNLINNAFEAKNSTEHIIKLSVSIFEENFKIKISDNGVGIASDKLKDISKNGYSTKGDNRGYGLSHAKIEVEKAKGSIEFKNKNGFLVLITLEVKVEK